MALHHATSGEIIAIGPLGGKLNETVSTALLKTPHLEVMRIVLLAGKSMPEHKVDGEITLQCLEGLIELQAHGKLQRLHAGEMVFLAGGEPHALTAIENASVLVTILLNQK